MQSISIRKARVHNLKNIDLEIPRESLVVITGPSGSGKSSLAFDTLYAEGQRRYIESLSSYARQFLGQMDPPDVDSISGLSPAIAIDQKSTSKNPRSTVGTITEIYDYLRILFARVGTPHCPESGDELVSQSAEQMVERLLNSPEGTKIQIMSPLVSGQKGEHKEMLSRFQALGFTRVRFNGEIYGIEDKLPIDKNKKNHLEVIIDRVVIKDGVRSRLNDSVEQALKHGEGHLIALINNDEVFFSEKLFSRKSGKSYPELEPRLFSFNSPVGACETCNGLGETKIFDRSRYIIDDSLSILEGAVAPLQKKSSFLYQMVVCIAKAEKIDLKLPFKKLPTSFRKILFEGSGDKVYTYSFESENSTFNFKKEFSGIEAWLEKKYHETDSDKTRLELEGLMKIEVCPACQGQRLAPYPLNVKINKKSIMDVCFMPVDEALEFLESIKFDKHQKIVADKLLKEILSRMKFLYDVGLKYLSLSRSAMTLSGGESQRIRLATQIGSALSGVLYVLDEPSIGLHQRDNDRLITTLKHLRDLGNTVIVVEHDEDTMRAADYLIDMGPGAGNHGGQIVATGTPQEVQKNKNSITGKYLSETLKIEIPENRRKLGKFISINKVKKNNLDNISVKIPLGGLVCIAGVSGSGKSTLVHQALAPAVNNHLNKYVDEKACYHSISGLDEISSIIELDQSPIGRTPKSNPATYTKLFDDIRTIFANTNESKMRGYSAGRFSFNVKGGRCETCEGNGNITVEMNFLPDVYVLCSDCHGKRYNKETLMVTYRGKNISDILKMTISEALEFFQNHSRIVKTLKTLNDVGLGYMQLGQSSTTLSGGEAQRLKLSRELSKTTKGHCLYILDEPTTGLHFEDIKILLKALNALVEQNNTVLVIEHNLDVVKTADWVIDLGPEGGKGGGKVVAEGTPEMVAKIKESATGQYLKRLFK